MGRKPLGAAVIFAKVEPHPPINNRQFVRRFARTLFERIIARRVHPIPFLHEPGDPGGVDRRVGDAHPNGSFQQAKVL